MTDAVTRPEPLRSVVVGISGASGAVYGVTLLRQLRNCPDVRVHLVATPSGLLNVQHELGLDATALAVLADETHEAANLGASIASGSFGAEAMVVAPCSMRTLAAVANAASDNLLTRAADVMLKERRRLLLMVREAPLNLAHLRNMVAVTEMGGVIFPPVPAFYQRPQSVDDLVLHSVQHVLDLLGLASPSARARWTGLAAPAP
jgi:4-hydroxy-3-polyprenylbenzoate decarboxylase